MSDLGELQARVDAALECIMSSGSVDGSHHKMWVLDQVVRILTACPTVQVTKNDYKGNPYTYDKLGESEAYLEWVKEFEEADEDGEPQYEWDEGVAP